MQGVRKMALGRDLIFAAISEALDHAYSKHGKQSWGRHELYGILAEEFDEVEEAIFEDQSAERLFEELVQVAAVCVRYLETGNRYHPGTI